MSTTAPPPHAVVIGSGFGGLAAAIRLGARGYRVTVLEKLDAPGGRAYVYRQDGFTFDAGPTIITAPTSEMARPKATSKTVRTPQRSCSNNSAARMPAPAPMEANCSPPSRSALSTKRRDKAAIKGTTKRLCAMTMAVGVNKIPHSPKGPARDSIKYTINPSTTEGMANKVFNAQTHAP